jgi:hypothetical protein
MNVVAYGVWVGLTSVAGMIILGLAICACASELQVDYCSCQKRAIVSGPLVVMVNRMTIAGTCYRKRALLTEYVCLF